MKFQEFKYERPDLESLQNNFNTLIAEFNSAASLAKQDEVMKNINNLRSTFESMLQIAEIRHTIDTTDKFYAKEKEFLDKSSPVYDGLITDYYKALAASNYRKQLEDKWGKQLFIIAGLTVKTFSPEVLEDLKEENRLSSEYTKLIASAQIPFEGGERNLAQMTPFTISRDRTVRKNANEAKFKFFEENAEELDRIFDGLVETRTKIAQKLGYNNFVGLAYDRMLRSDYNPEMVANFRRQVKEHIVPAAQRLVERQRRRTGIDHLYYYDLGFKFKSGNPKPHGPAGWMINNAQKMYRELSKETGDFFQFMVNTGLLDLVSKKGKASGGYCTYISEYKAPFIFSNFNGTSGDVEVLTHEAGHAFQAFTSRDHEVPEYISPTSESCEIHSMSMEFFTWPWMELFFEEEANKYRFSHLSDALMFIPYGVAVDEFQHVIYENPGLAPKERNAAWRRIERQYLPYKDYAGNGFLEAGGYWQQQLHIYKYPFYYIDYTLAQICAFQFWKRANNNRKKAWEDYVRLCKEGGSKSFLQLVKVANLTSPFENGCISGVISDITAWLNNVDETK